MEAPIERAVGIEDDADQEDDEMDVKRQGGVQPPPGDVNVTLWQFLLELLASDEYSNVIQWTSRDGEFQLLKAEEVARLWGMRKNKNSRMNYDKLSRALRYYYQKNIIKKVQGQKFVYRFVGVAAGDYRPSPSAAAAVTKVEQDEQPRANALGLDLRLLRPQDSAGQQAPAAATPKPPATPHQPPPPPSAPLACSCRCHSDDEATEPQAEEPHDSAEHFARFYSSIHAANMQKLSEHLNMQKMSEHLNMQKMSEQLNMQKMSEQLNMQKMSEQLDARKLQHQQLPGACVWMPVPVQLLARLWAGQDAAD